MTAEQVGISGVFRNSHLLQIPFFQRHYKWNEENWDRFAEDMESLIDRNQNYKYFLGCLILKKNPNISLEESRLGGVEEKYDVVDGQQRLTTLSIYLKALINYTEEKQLKDWINDNFFGRDDAKTPVIHHNIDDKSAYQDVMWDNPLDRNYKSDRIISAYNHFKNRLVNKKVDHARAIDLFYAVRDHVSFVRIILNEQDDEQQIFDTINSLGVKLTIDELMKNYLYDSDKEQEYKHNWKPVFDDSKVKEFWQSSDALTSQAANYQNTVIYNFFYDFVRIKMWDYRERLKGSDRIEFVKKYRVLETCKAFVERFGANKQELANEIIEYAKLYKEYFDKQNLDKPIARVADISRIACIAIAKEATIKPYLLYILKNVEDENERNRIFGFLETFIVRRAICNCDNKQASEFFTEQLIGQQIKTAEALREYILNRADVNMHMPNDEEVTERIHMSKFSKEVTPRLILYLSEIKNSASDIVYNNTYSEMIIPNLRNSNTYPKHEEGEFERERQRRIHTIGNYFLLNLNVDVKQNNDDKEKQRKTIRTFVGKLKEQTFIEKKTKLIDYFNSLQCMNWLRDQKNWTEQSIDVHNNNIAKMINRLWPIDLQ